jgi:hypothetical protein
MCVRVGATSADLILPPPTVEIFIEGHDDSGIKLPLERGKAVLEINLVKAVRSAGRLVWNDQALDASVLDVVLMFKQDNFVLLWFHDCIWLGSHCLSPVSIMPAP